MAGVGDDKTGWERGTRGAPLSEAQVSRVLARALPGRALRSFEWIAGGLINTNLKLQVEGLEGALVLRVYTRDPSACRKEADLHALVSVRVPVPEVLYANAEGSEEIGPHLLMRWIEGLTLRQLKARRNAPEIAEAADSIGATLARIGGFTFPRPGPIGPGLVIGPPFIEGPDPIPTFVEKCLSNPVTSLRLGQEVVLRIQDHVWSRATQLSELSEDRRLVHSDFNSPNVIVDRVEDRWTVVGVLDWEFAHSGSPLFDVGNFLRYERRSSPLLEPHFSDGYRESGGVLPESWRELSRLCDLTSLCEILTRPDLPESIVPEVADLIAATIEDRDPR